MPLPFLTAEPEDVALPHDDHDRWRRPYRPGPWRVAIGAVLLLIASFMLLATMIIAFSGTGSGAVICLVAALAVVAGTARMLRGGVWVSRAGLRRVSFFGTRSVPWSQVGEIRTVQQPVRWMGLPRTVQGQALTATPAGGAQLPVLFTDHGADFLARAEAFERAADTIGAWAEEYRAVPAGAADAPAGR
ncbi:PH domain-containing protein [Streptomyces sp. NPDC048603]|uniref:PH domain-containing protein n=1 Tax=Streptomyces sp. NPDC048603 TaxID=3365577 RepID=UPI00371B10EF